MSEAWTIAAVLVGTLTAAGWLTWVERRLLAFWQERLGPNRTGPEGVLQPLADTIKLFFKHDWIPPFASRGVFVIAPALVVVTALLAFAIIPFTPELGVADPNIGVLFFLATSSLGAYSVVLAGWSSNNKYSLLGGLRSAAQLLGYEVFMGLSLMGVVAMTGSFSLRDIVAAQRESWFIVPQALGCAVFFVAALAETHRAPFDLPEAESELVAGYHIEYSGMKFGLFMVGEYLGILLASALITVLFLGGWHGPLLPPLAWFLLKSGVVIAAFVLMRGALPRPRYDQLVTWGWKVLLPLSLVNLLLTGVLVVAQGAPP